MELGGLVRPATERDHRLVLEQDHRVRLGSGLHLLGEFALQRERLAVGRQAIQVEEDSGSHDPAGSSDWPNIQRCPSRSSAV